MPFQRFQCFIHASSNNALQRSRRAVLPDADLASVLVRPCPDPKFGDYQSNVADGAGQRRGR